MSEFQLDVVTPEAIVFTGQVSKVNVPSTTGQLGILPRHAPLFATLDNGEVIITQNTKTTSIAIGSGFIQVTPTQTTVLVSRAKNADELNEAEIKAALDRAKEALSKKPVGNEQLSATAMLHQSLVDLKIIRRLKNRHH